MASKSRVVVVTGASSGIGRATAVEFARRGASLVLAARREEALRETAELCAGAARVVCVPTDVTHEQEVQALAERALELDDRIDVWVNNAGVTLFAPLEGGTFDEHKRVIETNLYGAILSARAVVPIFRRQRHGVLINVGSILSRVGQPAVPSYVISKFGLRGVSEALRSELAELRDVHVCTVFPYAVDTQHFEAGGNELGREIDPMQPVQQPEAVARAIVELSERPRRERYVPRYVELGVALHELFPRTVERLLSRAIFRFHVSDRPQPKSAGNLYAPSSPPAETTGSHPPEVGRARFTGWTLRELFRLQGEGMRRLLTGRRHSRAAS